MNDSNDEFEKKLRGMFERNFQRLRAEAGHALAPDVKEAAWQQVLMYWRRLQSLAESITDTEVKLNLPNQKTPKGRPFCIEGVVDIVREADRTTMYDIKTHELDFVQENRDFYSKQLNVYAYIWQTLRKERLDETAVISTPLPEQLKQAFAEGNAGALTEAAKSWDPVVQIDFDQGKVGETVREFADAVDAIEDGRFSPPGIQVLKNQREGKRTFGTRVCGECDARFSCPSFRQFAKAPLRRDAAAFLSFYDTLPTEMARYSWLDATSEMPDASEVERDFR